jgi:hypothetical protein
MKRTVRRIRRIEYEVSWLDFTDEQLSMVLSHIAGGGSFCAAPKCLSTGGEAADTITRDPMLREFLRQYGYEYLGCALDTARSTREHYLNMAERRISNGEKLGWSHEEPL